MTERVVIASIFLVCVAIAALGSYAPRLQFKAITAGKAFGLIPPFVFPLVMVVLTIVFWWPGPEDKEPAWHLETTNCLLLLYPVLCALSIWRSTGYRWFAVALIPLSLFISAFATVWAIACVTGD
jgi:hypothetical protein